MAIGANSVGDALHRQLAAVADDLVCHVIADCGHIVPLDRPEALLDLVAPFLSTPGAAEAVGGIAASVAGFPSLHTEIP